MHPCHFFIPDRSALFFALDCGGTVLAGEESWASLPPPLPPPLLVSRDIMHRDSDCMCSCRCIVQENRGLRQVWHSFVVEICCVTFARKRNPMLNTFFLAVFDDLRRSLTSRKRSTRQCCKCTAPVVIVNYAQQLANKGRDGTGSGMLHDVAGCGIATSETKEHTALDLTDCVRTRRHILRMWCMSLA
jgi:hypothetical protein